MSDDVNNTNPPVDNQSNQSNSLFNGFKVDQKNPPRTRPHLRAIPTWEQTTERQLKFQTLCEETFRHLTDEDFAADLVDGSVIQDLEVAGAFDLMLDWEDYEVGQAVGWLQNRLKLRWTMVKALEGRLEALRGAAISPTTRSKKEIATYNDYAQLFSELWPGAIACQLSGRVMYQDRQGRWQPAKNMRGVARSKCHDLKGFSASKVNDHFDDWTTKIPNKLILDIPKWDGRDRIREIASAIHCKNFSTQELYELLLDWGATAVRRFSDPFIRNRILIFQGDQHIGKDWLIDALIGGFNTPGCGYVQDCKIDDSGELELRLHKALFFSLAEFDKTAKVSVSTLKDLITKPYSTARLKYDGEEADRPVVASFIASANPVDLLRDPTGHSRYVVVSIEKIDYPYPGVRPINSQWAEKLTGWPEHRKQIAAQFYAYAAQEFKASKETEKKVADWNKATSQDVTEEFLRQFDRLILAELEKNLVKGNIYLRQEKIVVPWNDEYVDVVIGELCKRFRWSWPEVLRRLKPREARRKNYRGYLIERPEELPFLEDSEESYTTTTLEELPADFPKELLPGIQTLLGIPDDSDIPF